MTHTHPMAKKTLLSLVAIAALLGAGAGAADAKDEMRGHRDRGAGKAMKMLHAADANDDKQVTRAEVASLREEMFVWMDRNADGVLSLADRSPIAQRLAAKHGSDTGSGTGSGSGAGPDDSKRGGRRGGPGRMDTDGDGSISRAEFAAGDDALFERLDADRDSIITGAEIEAAREERRSKREWWRESD